MIFKILFAFALALAVSGLPAPQFRLEPQALQPAPTVEGLVAPQFRRRLVGLAAPQFRLEPQAIPVAQADPQPAAPFFAPKGRAPLVGLVAPEFRRPPIAIAGNPVFRGFLAGVGTPQHLRPIAIAGNPVFRGFLPGAVRQTNRPVAIACRRPVQQVEVDDEDECD